VVRVRTLDLAYIMHCPYQDNTMVRVIYRGELV